MKEQYVTTNDKNKTVIKNLVFQGGSVKGIAYPSALKRAEEIGEFDLKMVERVAGTSAGAITAMLLAVGYSSEDIDRIISNFDFTAVLDESGKIPTRGKILGSVQKSQQGQSTFFAKIPAKTVKIPIINRLTNNLGVYNGTYFLHQTEKWIEAKTDIRYLTFEELHELHVKNPTKYKDLYVLGVNVNTNLSHVFSYEKTPKVIISDAVRVSMSIPLLFVPHQVYIKVYIKERGVRIPKRKLLSNTPWCTANDIWCDGGLFDNYPLFIFDRKKYMTNNNNNNNNNNQPNETVENPETLGFRLLDLKEIDYFEGKSPAPRKDVNNVSQYMLSILTSSMGKQNSDFERRPNDKKRSVYIDTLGISMLEFNITKQQQQALKQSGRRAVDIYFKGKSDIELPTTSTQVNAVGSNEPMDEFASSNAKSICNLM